MRTCIYSPITLTPRQSFSQIRQSQKRLDQNRRSKSESEERVEESSLQQNAIVFCVRSRRLVYFFPFSHYVRFRAFFPFSHYVRFRARGLKMYRKLPDYHSSGKHAYYL
jgi:hypothetical protein